MTARPPLRAAAAGIIIASLAVLVLAADQFTKFLAIALLPSEQPVQILGDALVFYLIRNPGAAFSLGEGVTWVFTIALAAVAIAIIVISRRVHSRAWAILLGLLLGGVLGNLTDRLFREPGFPVGHVVDFISTPWMMPAIYNVADIFIVTMMIGVALLVLIGLRFDGTRERAAETPVTADGEATPVGTGTDRDAAFPVGNPDVGAPPTASDADESRRD
ncbi:signal peptidase II [Microbacterium caowuchunii]|uniref:signal peptidase II n=1 Tax=Microbacterium caowuchunii TaxID=2614638 RepID=UPI001248A714|nr:signal peptidase II [Microbacterium caowuchunii]QEW00282.1 signal peptidase II [Microbacterium caowuchunii]